LGEGAKIEAGRSGKKKREKLSKRGRRLPAIVCRTKAKGPGKKENGNNQSLDWEKETMAGLRGEVAAANRRLFFRIKRGNRRDNIAATREGGEKGKEVLPGKGKILRQIDSHQKCVLS